MIGIDVGLPTVFVFSPLLAMIGQVLFKVTIALGILVFVSHVVTRFIKLFL